MYDKFMPDVIQFSVNRSFVGQLEVFIADRHFSKCRNYPRRRAIELEMYIRGFPKEFRWSPHGERFSVLCCQMMNCDKRFEIEIHRSRANHPIVLLATENVEKYFPKCVLNRPRVCYVKSCQIKAIIGQNLSNYSLLRSIFFVFRSKINCPTN